MLGKAPIAYLGPSTAIPVDVGGLDPLSIYVYNAYAIPLSIQVHCQEEHYVLLIIYVGQVYNLPLKSG